ncbi:hypothetical protein E3N88_13758 [Mikania micrantha]|uniref:Uncharacterized protein n=1 Tax=Mikania micrantha TaxID=192012 RepID=A0A5N6P0P8_9ASTR|nr:hypothetical protein E3N88_13758 [Mikania micrantha]
MGKGIGSFGKRRNKSLCIRRPYSFSGRIKILELKFDHTDHQIMTSLIVKSDSMPSAIEDLNAAIQDITSQANLILILFLNHNILEECERRQKKIEELLVKLKSGEKELIAHLEELRSLKVKKITFSSSIASFLLNSLTALPHVCKKIL